MLQQEEEEKEGEEQHGSGRIKLPLRAAQAHNKLPTRHPLSPVLCAALWADAFPPPPPREKHLMF